MWTRNAYASAVELIGNARSGTYKNRTADFLPKELSTQKPRNHAFSARERSVCGALQSGSLQPKSGIPGCTVVFRYNRGLAGLGLPYLEIMAKTVIPGYNVVGTSKCILSQAGTLSRLPFIAFKMKKH